MSVRVDIYKDLGDFKLDVRFAGGDEVVALLGASGCGKSMTLKCIAGIEKPDRGRIEVDGATLFDSEKKINLSPQERHTGLLFQNYALFPNMTVMQNIRAGARREKDAARREALIRQITQGFGLTDLARRYPRQLSGGEQQRAALARILVSSPSVLLLDEPFSALDSHLRFTLEREVREVIRRFAKSVILVSHDRDEVFRLSDKIAVMNDGRIEAFGEKKEVFARPLTQSAAVLTGCKNISRVKVLDNTHVRALDWGMELTVCDARAEHTCAGIRMHDIRSASGPNSFVCRVAETLENPFSFTVMLVPENAPSARAVGWELDKDAWRRIRSDTVEIQMPPEAIILLKG